MEQNLKKPHNIENTQRWLFYEKENIISIKSIKVEKN